MGGGWLVVGAGEPFYPESNIFPQRLSLGTLQLWCLRSRDRGIIDLFRTGAYRNFWRVAIMAGLLRALETFITRVGEIRGINPHGSTIIKVNPCTVVMWYSLFVVD